jgi:hypothetical protein
MSLVAKSCVSPPPVVAALSAALSLCDGSGDVFAFVFTVVSLLGLLDRPSLHLMRCDVMHPEG